MGILNVTPDSFSDGGKYTTVEKAIEHAGTMLSDGADILDIGGESTRPGSDPVTAEDELRRVIPVIEALCKASDVVVSIDTTKAVVAEKAISAGACIINDVSALTHDPAMAEVAISKGAGVVLMHMLGTPGTMQDSPAYNDVIRDIAGYLDARISELASAGLAEESIAVDPGIGFGKTLEHNLRLIASLKEFGSFGKPVVMGLSRKSFLGRITGREVDERLAGSIAALAYCVLNGVDIMRVHDVRESRDAIEVLAAIRDSGKR
ncbi:MAG: dihydropteroate synthase [Kiritimatiellia bacterium]|jgi:dihydropteroate synthase|nr:dihydropteroate synthase [Kiritimatiellia bacterium]MDP6848864.1 dihydropteroate synthase [Kiritimatiellia bacterium]